MDEKLKPDDYMTITKRDYDDDLARIRREALEEAAKIAEDMASTCACLRDLKPEAWDRARDSALDIADAIRALASKPTDAS